eukprot:scaffold684_cov150-Skeletonema_menzelii.AAC.3
MQLSASTSWIDSTQRRLSNCKWHRKPSKCNDAPGCFHNGNKCVMDTSRITESNCSLYDRRRRMCRSNECFFDVSTRKCFELTQAPMLMPTLTPFSIEPPSPSQHPSSTNSSSGLSLTSASPSTMPTTDKRYLPSAMPSTVLHVDTTFDPSISPTAPPTVVSPTNKATVKPTLPLRSQEYCSKLHKKPRRCINRGCLYDSSTLQCTNGVPTSTPSSHPSTSPSTPKPTNKPHRVRLYWEQGYKWQEDPTEKFYCWACAQCRECPTQNQARTPDCVDLLCDVRHHCKEGMSIALTDCDPNQPSDVSAAFSFVPGHSGLFHNDFKGGQIQVHNSDLCLSQSGVRYIELETCDASKIEQRFLGFQSGEGPMELSPVNTTMKDGKVVEQCITNHHHPRAGERIFSEECSRARRSDTSLWTVY